VDVAPTSHHGLEFSSESGDFSDDDDDANNNNNDGNKAYDTSIVPFSGGVSDEFSFRQLIGDWLHWHFDEVYNHYYRQMVHQLPQHLIHMSDNELLVANNLVWIFQVTEQMLYQRACVVPLREVCERIYIGNYESVCSRLKLRELGVTHIVNAAAGHCKALFADEFIYLNLELKDVPQQALAESTQFANRFIGDALDNYRNAVVAVHCSAGVSRSVAIVLSYLLECRQMRLDQAFEYMRSRRCTLSPNEGFVRQLIDKEIKQFGEASISPHSIWLPMPDIETVEGCRRPSIDLSGNWSD